MESEYLRFSGLESFEQTIVWGLSELKLMEEIVESERDALSKT